MQWTGGKIMGCSTADADKLYLPVDIRPGAPHVEAQEKDKGSLLNTVKALLRLRGAEPDLQAKPNLEILYAEKGRLPFIYRRGAFVIVINPGEKPAEAPVPVTSAAPVYAIGRNTLEGGQCRMEGQSFGIWKT
jgi:maltose alpha-D-glucosyltransferase/alpha-amylase